MKYFVRKRVICVWIVLFVLGFSLIGCGGTVSKKHFFSRSDTEGNWKMIGFGRHNYEDFGNYGSMTVNASGEITGGSVSNFGIDIETFNGGALTITPEGSVTGVIDTFLPDSGTSEEQTMPAGQMTLNKNVIVQAVNFTLARKGLGILVKRSGDFAVSDLEGTWVFPLEGIFSVSVNNSGAITNCTFLPVEGDAKGCKGNFLITPQGDVSGVLETIDGKTFKIDFNGQMNSNKDGMILAGGISTRFEGMAMLAIKKDGIFSLEDRKGSWKIFIAADKDVLHGTININSSGVVTGGDWTTLSAGSGAFEGGTLSLTKQGDVTGFINTSTGDTYIIIGGQMVSTKDLVEFLSKDEAGRYGVAILIKTP